MHSTPFVLVMILSLAVVFMVIGVTVVSMFRLKPRQVETVGRSAGVTLYVSMAAGIVLLLVLVGGVLMRSR